MKQKVIQFDIVTIFPKMLDSYVNESMLKRAQEKKLIKIQAHDIRAFSKDKHRKVDDRPFGGGAGMVMTFQPIADAVRKIKGNPSPAGSGRIALRNSKRTRVILFSTRGKQFDATTARRLAKYDQLILICGRYEGVDERVADAVADEEISIGDFVVTGGELGAMIMIDAVSRHIPGVLGKHESLEEQQGSYKTYTRPEVIEWKPFGKLRTKPRRLRVPKVLLSGDHKKIKQWRGQGGG